MLSWFSVEELRANFSFDIYDVAHSIYKVPSYHLAFEVFLIVCILWLVFAKSYKPRRSELTEKEKDDLIAEWTPQPLVPDVPSDHPALKGYQKEIEGPPGKVVNINGKEYVNMSSLNFLDMIGNKEIEDTAIKSLRVYGVGSCGPRGFYGTVDVHLKLEEHLSRFMGCEEAILYSYGFSTISSAIPAYSKKGDVIFVDEGVCFAVQKGLEASRSTIRLFKHNDMADLERLLQQQAAEDVKAPKKAKVTRRFLVVEGIYANYGDLCPLPQLIALKEKYKLRLFVDESISFGVLGATGRGITEHYDCKIDDVDMISASLENSVGSIGGFCCGKAYVIDHQRLSGQGYCFSASLPPMLASAAIQALTIMETNPVCFRQLMDKCKLVHASLQSLAGLSTASDERSPVQHLRLREPLGDRGRARQLLDEVVERCFRAGVALTEAQYLDAEELRLPEPSIRLAVNMALTNEEIKHCMNALSAACKDVFTAATLRSWRSGGDWKSARGDS